MTDLRALLAAEAASHRRTERIAKRLFAFVVLLALTVAAFGFANGKSFASTFGTLFPLLFVGSVAVGYKPRHLKALQDAISDSDPELDGHFATALAMEHVEAAAIGRRAFVERFQERLPELNPSEWRDVAQALPKASVAEAEGMLRLIDDAAPASAIEGLEAFADATSVERLKTAARRTLGDVRFRVAKGRVLESGEIAADSLEAERQRLRL